MQRPYTLPTRQDQEAFLLRLYFGSGGDPLDRIVRRAYQDLSRTVHGVGAFAAAYQDAAALLRSELQSLPVGAGVHAQPGFDIWHETTCQALCNVYAAADYKTFYVGQAQKWVNMALKYIYVFGEERLPGYASLYPLCHVPIDNILLSTEEFKELLPFREAWSRIRNYSEYMSFQAAVRTRFPDIAPLAIEFHVWQRPNAA
jgi:hypothetical protein